MPMVKDIAITEVKYSSIEFSLWPGDISVQSKTTMLNVDTSFKIISYSHITAASPSYCPPS